MKASAAHQTFRVIFNASALPDPDLVSYDLLLTYVLCICHLFLLLMFDTGAYYRTSISTVCAGLGKYPLMPALMLFTVEADYTVVFFAAGSRHAPPTNWIWKAYRSLSRKYRKNLKQLVRIFPAIDLVSNKSPVDSTSSILRSSPRVRSLDPVSH